jgi:hypothetical protein
MAYILIAVMFLFTSCASIINGPDQRVSIQSDPPGADIELDGKHAGHTPTVLKILRNKDHVLVLTKEGYLAQKKNLKRELSSVAILYILPGGLASFALDATSGAQFCFPDKVDVKLEPDVK